MKFKRATTQASGDDAGYYSQEAEQTMFGADVYGNEFRVLAAMPKREKNYFMHLMEVKPQDREEVLELVPDNLKDFYVAQWDKMELKEMSENAKDYDEDEFNKRKNMIYNRMRRIRGRRAAERKVFEETASLPSEDWIGWDPRVDLDDIKLQYILQTGRDHHYFDLWDDRIKTLRRKPYLEGATDEISPLGTEKNQMSQVQLYRKAAEYNIQIKKAKINRGSSDINNIELEYQKNRELEDTLRDLGEIV